MILAVALNPSIDKTFVTPSVRLSAIHRPTNLVRVAGGKGLNLARAAQTMGAPVRVAAILAGHSGRWIEEELERLGLGADVVWADGETRSSLSVLDAGAAELTEFYEEGPEISVGTWGELVSTVVTRTVECPIVAISGSVPRGIDAGGVSELIRDVRRAGATVAVDLRGEALTAALDAGPDMVKVNLAEALEASDVGESFGPDGGSPDPTRNCLETVARACDDLWSRMGGCPGQCAIVTSGCDGAVIRTSAGVWSGEAADAGAYSVGSGDAFLGAVLACIADGPLGVRDSDPEVLLRVGMGAGAANAVEPGPGSFDAASARRLAARVVVRRIEV